MVLPSAPVEDGDTVSYTYDNSGALAKVTDSATGITTTYYYDFTDRLLRYEEESTTLSHTVGYGYDTINNLTSLVETINGVTHTTSYEYDDDNRITKVLNGETSKSYTYDAYSRVTERTTKHGETTVFTDEISYFAPEESTTATTGQISMLRYVLPGGGLSYSYTYDDNGNILSVAFDNEQARPVIENTSYVYDTANQLIRESNSAAGKTWVWTYDNAGNILSRTEYDYLDTGLTTPLDTVTYSYSDSDSDWGDLLTGYDGNTITSDEIGNMLSDGTWTYTWEHGRQLASMSDGTTTWNYTYNSDGLRTSRSNGTTTYNYIYNGSQLTQMTVTTVDGEETVTDTLYFTYDASGIPMTVTYNDVVYYYVTNIQGDVVAILNSSGNVMVNYAYDAWGNVISALGSNALAQLNPLRYRGYVYDTETELYYLQSRYYNPELGRFISSDVLVYTGQGLLGNNMFAYCLNNPVNYFDYSGEFAVSVTLIKWAIAAGASAISNAVSMKISGGSVTDCLLAALAGAIGGTVGFLISWASGNSPQGAVIGRGAATLATDLLTTWFVDGEVTGDDLALAGMDAFADVCLSTVGYYYNPFNADITPIANSLVDAFTDGLTDIFQTSLAYGKIGTYSSSENRYAMPGISPPGGKYAQYFYKV